MIIFEYGLFCFDDDYWDIVSNVGYIVLLVVGWCVLYIMGFKLLV